MKPSPCGFVSPKPHSLLQIFCASTGFLRHDLPHDMKPKSKRVSGTLKKSSGCYRSLMSTILTAHKGALSAPSILALAPRTLEAVRPAQTGDVIVAVLLCDKSCDKFFKIVGVILLLQNNDLRLVSHRSNTTYCGNLSQADTQFILTGCPVRSSTYSI